MKIAVVTPKSVSCEKGGAENLYEGLVSALNKAGHRATQIDILVDESSFERILESYCNCFYLNLDDYDLVISTKAPTYMVRHRNHISYLLHPIRVFYDMFNVEYNSNDKEKQKQKKLIHEFDKYGLNPSRVKKHCVIGEVVAQRMRDADPFWNDVNFKVIYPAPIISTFLDPKKGEFIFLPGRLHRWKRVDLIIKAMGYLKNDTRLLLAGAGEDANDLRKLVHNLGLDQKVQFLGKVSDEELLDLYSRAILVPFVPIQEDYGYITIEAFRARKPVITCKDSGEPANIVKESISGFIVDPDPKKIAEKMDYLIENPDEAVLMGENGFLSVQNIIWENGIKELLENLEILPENKVTSKINVLIADTQPIDPAVGGGRLRLKGLYSNLGENIKPLYIGTFDWKGEKKREVAISSSLNEFDVPLDNEHFKLNDYFNKLLPDKTIIDSIFPFLGEASPEFVRAVRAEAEKADVLIISHPWLYPIIKTEVNLKNKVLIYDSQNCEAILRSQLLGSSSFAKCIVNMVKFVEKELCEESNLILACSEVDKQQFEQLYDLDSSKVEVFPNGVDAKEIQPIGEDARINYKKKLQFTQKTVIFVGSEYSPNVEAGNFIINTLADECPDVYFLIIGGVGNQLNSKNKSNVKIYGRVSEEEKNMLLSASDIAINPMLHGSGTNIKMFDFMAAGLPTISSPVGARGIVNEDSFIVAELSNFSSEIRRVLSNKDVYDKLSLNGRTLVEQHYDWNKISSALGKKIVALYQDNLPYFSVVIPTLRGEQLHNLIQRLNRQTYKNFEAIIVDSGENREASLQKLCNFELKYFFDKKAGAVQARNIGLKHAEGKIIAFTDDDCEPDLNWLKNANELFERKNIIGIEGYIFSDEAKRNDPNYRLVTNEGFEGLGFMTANLFIRRDIIEKVGGFDERFDKPHFREDTDLAWRAQDYGFIPYSRDVRVYHPPHFRNNKGESKKERDKFFINDPLLFAKHPDKYLKLMKTEGHYKYNDDFWQFFLEGCMKTDEQIPINVLLKDTEIRKFVPEEIKHLKKR
jgi:glycosyltransferase involved in cell wall biosynthesis